MPNKITKVLARATDHLLGENDHDRPDVPILTQKESYTALWIRITIILVNIITCIFIIAGIIRHW